MPTSFKFFAMFIFPLLAIGEASAQAAMSSLDQIEARCNRTLSVLGGSFVREAFFESRELRQATCKCASARLSQIAVDLESARAVAGAKLTSVMLSCYADAIMKTPEAAPPSLTEDFAGAIFGSARPVSSPKVAIGESCKPPEYPMISRRSSATGTSIVDYKVDASGRVTDSRVIRSAGTTHPHKLLDAAVQFAFMACTFTQGSSPEDPVTASVRIAYVWKLD